MKYEFEWARKRKGTPVIGRSIFTGKKEFWKDFSGQ